MNLIKKPEGYISAFPSHTDPVCSTPPPKLIQQKQQETLLGSNLKSFIKQRLFGNFINYTKFYNHKKSNFTPYVTSLPDLYDEIESHPMRSSPAFQQSYKQRISQIRGNMERKINERYSHNREKSLSNNQSLERKYQDRSMEQSSTLNSQMNKVNYSARTNKHSFQTSRVGSTELQKYPASSFISAIEEHYDHPKKMSSARKEARLSPIHNKVELISKLQKVKDHLNNQSHLKRKNPNRIDTLKYEISDSKFQLFCQPIKKGEKVNTSLSNDAVQTIDNAKKSIIGNKSNASIQKSKLLQPRTHFVKETFIQYLNNPKQNYPSLALQFYNFFELNSKIYDEIKLQEYKVIVQSIASCSSRVWAISSFRFWDCNQDGIICSKDMFAVYQLLDEFQDKLRLQQNYKNMRGYKLLIQLRSILSQLSTILTENNENKEKQKKLITANSSNDDKFQIKYLQQALLRKRQLKYSDLLLILGHNIKNAAKDTKKSVFQTQKELSMKYSSCYRYSYIATDHNEQTRQDREHIEMLKEQLKRQKIELLQRQSMEGLEKDKMVGIDYKTYYEKEVFLPMKNIVLDIFAIQLV